MRATVKSIDCACLMSSCLQSVQLTSLLQRRDSSTGTALQ